MTYVTCVYMCVYIYIYICDSVVKQKVNYIASRSILCGCCPLSLIQTVECDSEFKVL